MNTLVAPTPAGPQVPEKLSDTNLESTFVTDLLLKTLYSGGAVRGALLSEQMCLPFGILDEILLELQQRHLVEVRGTEGRGRKSYVFDLTSDGRQRAREAMSTSRYVGPAPVTFERYVQWVDRQSVRDRNVTPAAIRATLAHLVLEESFLDAVGAAANSGTALFLYGAPGNGKTAAARALARIASEPIYVPHAIVVPGGTIIQVFDPTSHERVEAPTEESPESRLLTPAPAYDQRFVRVHRPAVVAGGELTMDQLELQYDGQIGAYRAPLQLTANGGVFIVDDFGRQRMPPRDLLNRWMVPLEEREDYLPLPTGHKLAVPFDCFLVFSTNLDPTELVEEAFLRRLRYKVPVREPSREQFSEILRRTCREHGLQYSDRAVDHVYEHYYSRPDIAPRSCHPRDLIAHVRDEARYRGASPSLDLEAFERACRTYFLELPAAHEHGAGDTAFAPES